MDKVNQSTQHRPGPAGELETKKRKIWRVEVFLGRVMFCRSILLCIRTLRDTEMVERGSIKTSLAARNAVREMMAQQEGVVLLALELVGLVRP